MKKELYYAKSDAKKYAEQFAGDYADAAVESAQEAVATDMTEFDYIDRDMNKVGSWSGELAGYVVRSGDGEDLAIFAYWDEEK